MPRLLDTIIFSSLTIAALAFPGAAQAQSSKLKDKARDIAGQKPVAPTKAATFAVLKIVGLSGATRFEIVEDSALKAFKKKLTGQYKKAVKEHKAQKRSASSRKIAKPKRPAITKIKGRLKTRADADALLAKTKKKFDDAQAKRKRKAEAKKAARERAREEAAKRRRSGGWG